ncbi:MAG: uroporphyrinogen decarboxylase family protein [Acetivibrionales bacterium]|jgi:uroporphyrinogen decarboxylase
MSINMKKWIRDITASEKRVPMPIMTYPGLELSGKTIPEVIRNGEDQFSCIYELSEKYPSAAAMTIMDLSVEAEVFGSQIRYSDNEVPAVAGNIISDEKSARELKIPQVGAGRTGAYIRAAALSARNIADRPSFGGQIGPFSLACRLFDMTEIMVSLFDDPDTVHIVLSKATTFLVSYAKAFREAGAAGMIIAEPAAGLLAPDQCDEFSSTYIKKIVEEVQDDSFMVILHNCGNTVRLVRSMLSTGALGLHFGNAVDMEDILPQIPEDRLAFGNIDPARVFKNGTQEDVREKTRDLLNRTSKYRNFVISSGCDIPPGTPTENIEAFFETVERFGNKVW